MPVCKTGQPVSIVSPSSFFSVQSTFGSFLGPQRSRYAVCQSPTKMIVQIFPIKLLKNRFFSYLPRKVSKYHLHVLVVPARRKVSICHTSLMSSMKHIPHRHYIQTKCPLCGGSMPHNGHCLKNAPMRKRNWAKVWHLK